MPKVGEGWRTRWGEGGNPAWKIGRKGWGGKVWNGKDWVKPEDTGTKTEAEEETLEELDYG